MRILIYFRGKYGASKRTPSVTAGISRSSARAGAGAGAGNPFAGTKLTGTQSSNPFASTKLNSGSSNPFAKASLTSNNSSSVGFPSSKGDNKANGLIGGGKHRNVQELLDCVMYMTKHHPKQSWSAGIKYLLSKDSSVSDDSTLPLVDNSDKDKSTTVLTSKPEPIQSPSPAPLPFGSKKSNKVNSDPLAPAPFSGFKFGGKSETTSSSTPSSGFNFGATASSTSKAKPIEFSFGKPASSSDAPPEFNFGKPASSSSKPEFSFGKPAIPSFTPSTTKPDESAESDGFPIEKPEEVARVENTDEDIIFECRSKLYVFVDGEWKAGEAGRLCLFKHKTEDKKRVVLRNALGNVRLNEAIGSGMTFKKTINNKKKIGSIQFRGREKTYMLRVKEDSAEQLHTNLEKMAS